MSVSTTDRTGIGGVQPGALIGGELYIAIWTKRTTVWNACHSGDSPQPVLSRDIERRIMRGLTSERANYWEAAIEQLSEAGWLQEVGGWSGKLEES